IAAESGFVDGPPFADLHGEQVILELHRVRRNLLWALLRGCQRGFEPTGLFADVDDEANSGAAWFSLRLGNVADIHCPLPSAGHVRFLAAPPGHERQQQQGSRIERPSARRSSIPHLCASPLEGNLMAVSPLYSLRRASI